MTHVSSGRRGAPFGFQHEGPDSCAGLFFWHNYESGGSVILQLFVSPLVDVVI